MSILFNLLDYTGSWLGVESASAHLMSHIDWGYSWIFKPVFLSVFIYPFILILFLYCCAIFLHLYKRRHEIKEFIHNSNAHKDKWDWARFAIAAVWEAQGSLWHGYDIQGFDKIPAIGPALLVCYHGTFPIDTYYFMAKCLTHKRRQIRTVGDRFLFKIPGWKLLMDVFRVLPGTIDNCVDILRSGHLMVILPGGVREAIFGDENYQLHWGQRIGFAKVALEAKVPIIPLFTKNCREAFRTISWGRRFLLKLYEIIRLPCVPMYGGFPVKLVTCVGDPIPYDASLNAEQLAEIVKEKMTELIQRHQQIPGSILRALIESLHSQTPHAPWTSVAAST
jgi:1-acyl-sn-glycerol-3-phosphate acyltransferase